MTGPDPQREPHSETEEKNSIRKAHEEFIGDDGPSMTKQEYEKRRKGERKAGDENEEGGTQPPSRGNE